MKTARSTMRGSGSPPLHQLVDTPPGGQTKPGTKVSIFTSTELCCVKIVAFKQTIRKFLNKHLQCHFFSLLDAPRKTMF
jgi:hypothetical protein